MHKFVVAAVVDSLVMPLLLFHLSTSLDIVIHLFSPSSVSVVSWIIRTSSIFFYVPWCECVYVNNWHQRQLALSLCAHTQKKMYSDSILRILLNNERWQRSQNICIKNFVLMFQFRAVVMKHIRNLEQIFMV